MNYSPCTVPQVIPDSKWSWDGKWSPKWTANDPGPQLIPKVDRKWSRKKNRNGLDSSLQIIVSILLLLQKGTLKANNYIKTKWKNFFQDFVKSIKSKQKINFHHTVIKTWISLSQRNTGATHRTHYFHRKWMGTTTENSNFDLRV